MKNISFSGPMMRALLDGRKTQTRRIHKSGKAKFEVGDLVWVKEGLVSAPTADTAFVAYECGKQMNYGDFPIDPDGFTYEWPWKRDKLNAMFCPRWASRVTIRITRVRELPLLPMSLEDARAEGFQDTSFFLDYFWKLAPKANIKTMVFAYDFEVVK